MKKVISFIFVLFLTLLAFNRVEACWCRTDPSETDTPQKLKKVVLDELHRSDAVFSGEVLEITEKDIKLKVMKVWKGTVSETEVIISRWYYTLDKQKKVWIECSFQSFQVGKYYLLYANLFENKLQVYNCSRSRFLNDAESDLEILDSWKSSSTK